MDPFQPDVSFDTFLQRILKGDQDACREFVDEYGSLVKKAVRDWLDSRVRPLEDSDDVAQEVWSSVFAEPTAIYDLDKPEQLRAALCALARSKAVDVNRRHLHCQKRDARRRVPLESPEGTEQPSLISREPAAHDVLVAEETWVTICQRQDPIERLALTLAHQGWKHRDIAEWAGRSEKWVQRLVRSVAPPPKPAASGV